MEASYSQINRHFYCRNLFSDDGSRSKFKPLIGSLSYARRVTALPRLTITMRIEGSREESPGSEIKTTLSNTADKPTQHMQGVGNSYPIAEQVGGNLGTDASVPVEGTVQQKKTAKIHDFCLGLPFGGLVLSGGLVGFLFSKNLTTLTTGVLYGGALLALSMYSLKVWRQGKSSLPFILGQSDEETLPYWVLCCCECCNAMLLYLCDAFWRKPATKEVEVGNKYPIITRNFQMPDDKAIFLLFCL